jgi:hypothetical protein
LLFRYRQSFDQSISEDLKKRFWKDVEVLENEGFRFFSLHHEVIWPFSVILFFPVYVLMASKEDVRVECPLRITSYHLLYVSKDEATFAYVSGLGCKFYTRFMDGTWLVSNTAQSIRHEKVIVLKREEEAIPTAQVLQRHDAKVHELQGEGMQPAMRVSFDHWVEIESRFDQSNVIAVVSMGIVWLMLLSWAIYWLVRSSVTMLEAIF